MHKFQLLILATIVVCAIGIAQAIPVSDEPELKKSCTNLCEHCGCVGYYCGDECICECDVTGNNDDIDCVATMQKNCEKMKLPYEVLIQGPTSTRFIRSLIHADPAYESLLDAEPTEERKTRSTITIYRPDNEAEESVQELESVDAIGGDAEGEEADDMVTSVHQPQAEPLTAEEASAIESTDGESTLDADAVEETKAQGTKREAVYDADEHAAVDTLTEESALNKRQADEGEDTDGDDVGNARQLIVQPTTIAPPPPPPTPAEAKAQLVRDALALARVNMQNFKESAATTRAQITDLVNTAWSDVREKMATIPLTPLAVVPAVAPAVAPAAAAAAAAAVAPKAAAAVAPAAAAAVLPVTNPLLSLFRKDPEALLPIQGKIQALNTKLAVKKAAAQLAIQAKQAAWQAKNILPVWNVPKL